MGQDDATSAEVSLKDDAGVAPESVQKKQSSVVVSSKGQRAIGACILSLAVGIAVGVFIGFRMKHSVSDDGPLFVDIFGNICEFTLYPETCNSTLSGSDTSNPKSVVSKSMTVSMSATTETVQNLTRCRDAWPTKSGMQFSTWQMCIDMYADITDAITASLESLQWVGIREEAAVVRDLEDRASSALTYHLTCVEGIKDHGLWNLTGAQAALCGLDTDRMTALLSNALSLLERFGSGDQTAVVHSPPGSRRRLLSAPERREKRSGTKSRGAVYEMEDGEHGGFPAWLSRRDRRLLAQSDNSNITVNAIVALDGSGNHTTIQEAVDFAPINSTVRYVIYIKKGIYDETVRVAGDKIRLTFIGEGAGETIITGNMSSRVNNVTTKFTATMAVSGDFFMAKNMTIRNTAGPDGHQAVALRVTGTQTAFTWLSIEGYQDTHYVHTSIQFYSHCTITGTIDFVFGAAAVVFQNCTLLARLPNPGQIITYTAGGIASPLVQKYAGMVFHGCTLDSTPELKQNGTLNQNVLYLGRPWRRYARTIIMRSYLGGMIDPRGWTLWNKNESSNTFVVYREFQNIGNGSDISLRVPWSRQLTPLETLNYSIDMFIGGYQWLPFYNVSYNGLL